MEKNISIYIDKLADKMGEKSAKVSMIIETFVLGFSSDLNAKGKVGFEPIGAFENHKHLEYIEEKEDGTKILFPPRLEVIFSSSAIAGILLSSDEDELEHTYQELHTRYGMSSEEISLFLSQLKSTLKTILLQEKCAVIPYIGTFEGELGGEIFFTPHRYFAELVNKPFSYFEPEVISPVMAVNDIVDKPVESIASVEVLQDKTDEDKEVVNVELPIEKAEEGVPENETSQESIPVEEFEEKTDDLENEALNDSTDLPKSDSEIFSKSIIIHGNSDVATDEAHSEQMAVLNKSEEKNINGKLEFYTVEKLLNDKDRQIKYYRRLSLVLVSLLFVLLLSFFLLWSTRVLAYNPVLESNNDVLSTENQNIENKHLLDSVSNTVFVTETEIDSVSTIKVDSVVVEPQILEESINANIKIDTLNFVLHKLKRGDTLRDISYKYYNDKEMWTLLVDANQGVIKNPNRIPVGEVIRIPKLVE